MTQKKLGVVVVLKNKFIMGLITDGDLRREIKLKDANVRDNLNTNRVFTGHKATVRPVLIPYLRKVAEERIAARKKNLS